MNLGIFPFIFGPQFGGFPLSRLLAVQAEQGRQILTAVSFMHILVLSVSSPVYHTGDLLLPCGVIRGSQWEKRDPARIPCHPRRHHPFPRGWRAGIVKSLLSRRREESVLELIIVVSILMCYFLFHFWNKDHFKWTMKSLGIVGFLIKLNLIVCPTFLAKASTVF